MPTFSRLAHRLAAVPLAATVAIWSDRVADPPAHFEAERIVEAQAATIVDSADVAPMPPQHPLHKVVLPRSRITVAISRAARDLLDRPMGSETIRDVDGCAYAFAVERHYHSPESGITPSGWHKGVTVYAIE
jgi:hypothetical protein